MVAVAGLSITLWMCNHLYLLNMPPYRVVHASKVILCPINSQENSLCSFDYKISFEAVHGHKVLYACRTNVWFPLPTIEWLDECSLVLSS